jgi:hypothetical protein
MEKLANILGEKPTIEHLLLVFFLITSIYMFRKASEFGWQASLFPQITAGITIVIAILLLVRNHLPGVLYEFVAEPHQMIGDSDVVDVDSTEEDTDGTYTFDIDDRVAPVITWGFSFGYFITALMIGFLYATPAFVAVYSVWARVGLLRTSALTITSIIIVLAFDFVLAPDFNEGIYTGWKFAIPV